MRVSELIDRLQSLLEEAGDVPVKYHDGIRYRQVNNPEWYDETGNQSEAASEIVLH